MKRNITFILTVILLVGVAGLVFLISGRINHSDKNKTAVSGVIEAKEVLISSEINGRVTGLNFDEGQMVTSGQLLAEIDPSPLEAHLAQAAADVASAQASLTQGQADYSRACQLYSEKIISYDQYQSASTRLNVVQSQLAAGRARQKYVQTQLNHARILAPIDGTISKKFIEAGEFVAPGTPVTSIVDLKDVWVKAYVPEDQLGRVNLGNKALVFLDSFPGQTFAGVISYISPESEFTPKNIETKKERVRLVFPVKIKVENNNGQFKPGLPADAEILTP